jgi:hypothetical protein
VAFLDAEPCLTAAAVAAASPSASSPTSVRLFVHFIQGDQSAYNLWSAYRRSRDLPAPIAVGELIDESAYEIIRDLCNFVSTRAIPINFDENLQRPANSDSTRMLKLETLEKYIGNVIKYF